MTEPPRDTRSYDPDPNRKYMDRSKPGRLDANGVEWWACDPYPTWYRFKNGKPVNSQPKMPWQKVTD